RAQAELGARDTLGTPAEEQVTAAEWQAARRAADQADDPHREITEHDLVQDDLTGHDGQPVTGPETAEGARNPVREGAHDQADPEHVERAKRHVHPAELDELRDLRALVEREHNPVDEDTVHVPTAAEAKDAVHQAERAMAEVRARQAADGAREAHDAETQASRVSHWHTRDQKTHTEDQAQTDGSAAAHERV
ncbi:MAG: hypothetical protein M3Z25_22175, partial [Actinomycetota bacterium]|nr:hypothetical protein [Actinomycetota bacterium]